MVVHIEPSLPHPLAFVHAFPEVSLVSISPLYQKLSEKTFVTAKAVVDMATEKTEFGKVNFVDSDRTSGDAIEAEWTVEEETAVRRKIDWNLVPLMTVLYLLCFLDRSNIGYVNLCSVSVNSCMLMCLVVMLEFKVSGEISILWDISSTGL